MFILGRDADKLAKLKQKIPNILSVQGDVCQLEDLDLTDPLILAARSLQDWRSYCKNRFSSEIFIILLPKANQNNTVCSYF